MYHVKWCIQCCGFVTLEAQGWM